MSGKERPSDTISRADQRLTVRIGPRRYGGRQRARRSCGGRSYGLGVTVQMAGQMRNGFALSAVAASSPEFGVSLTIGAGDVVARLWSRPLATCEPVHTT